MRLDLSRTKALLQGRMLKEHQKRELEQKCKIAEIGLKHFSEDLKNKELLPRLQRSEDTRTKTNNSIKIDCSRHT